MADALSHELLCAAPFSKRYLLVPNQQIREFLLFHLAKKLGVAAGVTICSLERAVSELTQSKKHIPSFIELSLAIEAKLRLLPDDPLYTPLVEYIEGETQERICSLSDELAHHFMRYGLYGRAFLPNWLKKNGWQQELWRSVFSEESQLTCPIEALAQQPLSSGQVHLFGFPALADPYLHFFAKSKAYFYQFSLCAEYWEDLCSDREMLAIDRGLCTKGASRLVREEMQHYLEERHSLLANWGRLGREWIKRVSAYDFDAVESYETPKEGTLLNALKKSLLEMQELESVEEKHSIQLHSAPSRKREVEVMHTVLLSVFAQQKEKGDPLSLLDVLILAPDISVYAPYIHTLFTASGLAHTIEGLTVGSLSIVAQGFFHLLSLAETELSLEGFLKLFSFAPFRKRFGFCLEDVEQVTKWLKSAHVRSGKSSWEQGVDRLLLGLAMLPDENNSFPLPCVEQTQIELLNSFYVALKSVEQSIDEMNSGCEKNLSEWLEWARTLLLSHFECDEEEPLLCEMQAVEDIPGRFPFTTLKRVLHYLFEKQSGKLSSSHLDKICCSSLKSGIAKSARVIYLLGMDEESFPRQEMISSLLEMPRSFPSKADEDRYLFLELLASAQDYFILSYERSGATSPKAPSSLILELMRYLKETPLTMHHPLFGFDPFYFKKESMIKNYSPIDYSLASAYVAKQIERCDFFSWDPLPREMASVQLRDLSQMARHPLQCYFNKRHGIYLEKQEQGDEALYLAPLERYFLRNKSMTHSLKAAIDFATQRGVLPEGLFKDVAIDLLKEEVEKEAQALKLLGVEASDLFSIELSLHCSSPKPLREGGWVVPALNVAGVQIVGKLKDVTPYGFLVRMKNDVEGVIAAWPLYLIFLHVSELCTKGSKALLFSKNGKSMILEQDPRPLLEEYIDYYFHALEKPSPLMPKWAKCLVQKEKELFCARVEKAFEEQDFYPDPYLEWMHSSKIAVDPKEWYERWMPYIEKRFSKVVEWSLTS